jgi:hypothetical protein
LAWLVLGGSVRRRPRDRRPRGGILTKDEKAAGPRQGALKGEGTSSPIRKTFHGAAHVLLVYLPVLPPHHLCSIPAVLLIFRQTARSTPPLLSHPTTPLAIGSSKELCSQRVPPMLKIQIMVHVSCVSQIRDSGHGARIMRVGHAYPFASQTYVPNRIRSRVPIRVTNTRTHPCHEHAYPSALRTYVPNRVRSRVPIRVTSTRNHPCCEHACPSAYEHTYPIVLRICVPICIRTHIPIRVRNYTSSVLRHMH